MRMWFTSATLGGGGRIARVIYPGLPDHPDHATARSLLSGGFGLLRRGRYQSTRHGYPETFENFFCLKLVDVHRFRTAKNETLRLDDA